MIHFDKITVTNFFSYGSSPTTLDLRKATTTLITGTNGSGKSVMIIDAICFALFGVPYRNINKGDLVNSINGKNCLVELTFDIGKDSYIVKRGIKKNIFEIYKNSILLDQSAAAKDYQKVLEDIIQLDFASFTNTVILSSANYVPFAQLNAAGRREVIDHLLDLGIFTVMAKIAKDKAAKNITAISGLEYDINGYKTKAMTLKGFIEKVEKEQSEKSVELDCNIEELEKNIANCELRNKDLVADKNELYETIGDASDISTKKSQMQNAIQKMQHVKSGFNTEYKFLSDNDNCPTCAQIISPDFKQNKINILTESIKKRDDAIIKAKDSIADYDKRLNEINNVLNDIKQLDLKIEENNRAIRQSNFEIKKYSQEKEKPIVTIDKEKKELKEVSKLILSKTEEKTALVEEKCLHDVTALLLKDNGIKSSIVKQYAEVLNKLVNHYLQTMGLFVSFSFDDNLNNITIKIFERDEKPYAALSEGEKTRVNLAILFAFRKVSELKNIGSCNLLIFDEILDSSLDGDGLNAVTGILEEFSDRHIFIVSHRDNVDDICQRKLIVSKKNNYSVIEEKI